jgi:uncharacterized protein
MSIYKESGVITLDYGPMQMTIQAGRNGQPLQPAAADGAKYAASLLDSLARVKHIARKPQSEFVNCEYSGYPEVLQKMITAVRQSGDVTLTPLAAVAGTIADMVADYVVAAAEATKVIVNNGGDIALRLSGHETVTVGVAPVIGSSYTHVLRITANDGVGGIATSGLGGRSFTKGIATAVTVAAPRAAMADACATAVANAVYTPHPTIKLEFAKNIDPDSDIGEHQVVCGVDDLPPEVVEKALLHGYQAGLTFYHSGHISGAALFVYNRGIMLPANFISQL